MGGFEIFILVVSVVLTVQGIFTLMWMLYAWEDPEESQESRSPKIFFLPRYSFSAIIPVRHEEKVIEDTILAVDRIRYPEKLKEIVVVCRADDEGTIAKAKEVIERLSKPNVRLVIFDSFPINKPHQLNIGLGQAGNKVITVFDAEDEPHPDIYNIVNTVLVRDKVDVVQSGVQLMNYRSRWFSALNVLEYFYWFKSGLIFFSKFGKVATLGGNTVFFKKKWLEKVAGWDENCLTEDADIGIRLVRMGAKIKVIYEELHVTAEETPADVESFIKQRTRWDQGFLQILSKGDWLKLVLTRQKLVALYILLTPLFQVLSLVYLPVGFFIGWYYQTSVWISLFSFIPMFLFGLQMVFMGVGIREFAKVYKLDYGVLDSVKTLMYFIPYQFLLAFSAIRAVFRIVAKKKSWEKTKHLNSHRSPVKKSVPSFAYVE